MADLAYPLTPGPWTVITRNSHKEYCVSFNTGDVDEIICGNSPNRIGLSEADAKLIAAAPRLLHCCQCVLDGYEHPERDGEFDWVDMACELREAIKEATEND